MDREKLYQRVLARVLSFLAYRPRTRKEIELRLERYFKKAKNVDESTRDEISQKILEYLEESKLINDEEFARLYIEAKSKGKRAVGKRTIQSKLIAKGIGKDAAEQYIDEGVSEDDELKAATAVLEKKFKIVSDDLVIRDKMAKYLLTRGFSYQIARQAVDYLLKRP